MSHQQPSLVDSLAENIRNADGAGPNWVWAVEDGLARVKADEILDEIGSDREVAEMRADMARQIERMLWGAR